MNGFSFANVMDSANNAFLDGRIEQLKQDIALADKAVEYWADFPNNEVEAKKAEHSWLRAALQKKLDDLTKERA